jgi:hypothetical protein
MLLKGEMCVIHTQYRRVVDRHMSRVRTVAQYGPRYRVCDVTVGGILIKMATSSAMVSVAVTPLR